MNTIRKLVPKQWIKKKDDMKKIKKILDHKDLQYFFRYYKKKNFFDYFEREAIDKIDNFLSLVKNENLITISNLENIEKGFQLLKEHVLQKNIDSLFLKVSKPFLSLIYKMFILVDKFYQDFVVNSDIGNANEVIVLVKNINLKNRISILQRNTKPFQLIDIIAYFDMIIRLHDLFRDFTKKYLDTNIARYRSIMSEISTKKLFVPEMTYISGIKEMLLYIDTFNKENKPIDDEIKEYIKKELQKFERDGLFETLDLLSNNNLLERLQRTSTKSKSKSLDEKTDMFQIDNSIIQDDIVIQFLSKLKRLHIANTKKVPSNIDNEFYKFIQTIQGKLRYENSIHLLIDRKNPLKSLFSYYWGKKNLFQTLGFNNIFSGKYAFKINFENEAGCDIGGLSYQMYSDLSTMFMKKNIFVALDESEFVVPNNDLNIKNIVGIDVAIYDFFVFIGKLFFSMLASQMRFDFNLSNIILLNMMYFDKSIKIEEYCYFVMIENPSIYKSFIQSLEIKDLKDIGFGFLDENHSTIKNRLDLIESIKQKCTGIAYEIVSHDSVKGFLDGIYQAAGSETKMKNSLKGLVLNKKKIGINEFRSFIKKLEITPNMINDYMLDRKMQYNLYDNSRASIEHPYIFKCVVRILTRPDDFVLVKNQSHMQSKYPKTWSEFIQRLLLFWTSIGALIGQSNTFRYTVLFQETSYVTNASTCFQQLKIGIQSIHEANLTSYGDILNNDSIRDSDDYIYLYKDLYSAASSDIGFNYL